MAKPGSAATSGDIDQILSLFSSLQQAFDSLVKFIPQVQSEGQKGNELKDLLKLLPAVLGAGIGTAVGAPSFDQKLFGLLPTETDVTRGVDLSKRLAQGQVDVSTGETVRDTASSLRAAGVPSTAIEDLLNTLRQRSGFQKGEITRKSEIEKFERISRLKDAQLQLGLLQNQISNQKKASFGNLISQIGQLATLFFL